MQCSRKGCENIMCDICIPCIGYICYGCKNEFRFYLESNGLNPTTEEEITKELKSFISSRRGNKLKFKTMETKYSKTEFEGYTHRFIVQFIVDENWRDEINIHIYSTSNSYKELEDFVNDKKSDKVTAFQIIHRATKEQDDMDSKLIEKTLKDI